MSINFKGNQDKRIAMVYSDDKICVKDIICQFEKANFVCCPKSEVVRINDSAEYYDFGNIRLYKQGESLSSTALNEMYKNIALFNADAIIHIGKGLQFQHQLAKSVCADEKAIYNKPCFYVGNNDNLEDAILFKRKVFAVAIRWEKEHSLSALIDGLNGEYIPVGNGYNQGFGLISSDLVPTKEAWIKGNRMADELSDLNEYKHIDISLKDMGIDGGVQFCKALSLMGIKPVWDKSQKVIEFKPMTKASLKRDRVKVEVNPLFSDYYVACFSKYEDVVSEMF